MPQHRHRPHGSSRRAGTPSAPGTVIVYDKAVLSASDPLVRLEQEVISHRYDQSGSAVLTRVWTRYLGFVTGMVSTVDKR